MRPTAAEIVKLNFPKLETNPLLKSSNKYEVLPHISSILPPQNIPSSSRIVIEEVFVEKENDCFVLSLEIEWKNENPSKLASRIIPPQYNYLYDHIGKDQRWYEFILVDTDSIELTHTIVKKV